MTDLKQFRENSIKRSLCEGYTDKWSEHKTKRELFELACDSNAVSYMAQSISEGWGLSPQYISEKFKPFINGKYICEYKNAKGNGYSSAMVCEFNENAFDVSTTLLCVIDSNTTLKIADYLICKIYIVGKSQINIELGQNSRCYLYIYGGDPLITGDVINPNVIIERYMGKEESNG
jgi:hypothetical protein